MREEFHHREHATAARTERSAVSARARTEIAPRDPQFIVTRRWIYKNRAPMGGWTTEQLKVLQVGFPPKPGWIDRCHGAVIADSDRQAFEDLRVRVPKEPS